MRVARKGYKWSYEPVEIKYPGGRCYCKSPGLKDKVTSWDFKGYYSSLMRTFNIGPDTLMLTSDLRAIEENKRPHIPLVLSPYTLVNQQVIDKFVDKLNAEGVDFTYNKKPILGYNLKIEVPVIKLELKKEDVQDFYINAQDWIDDIWKTYDKTMTIKRESFHGFFFKFKKSRVSAEGVVRLAIGMPHQCYFRQDFDSIVRIGLNVCKDERDIWKAKLYEYEEALKKIWSSDLDIQTKRAMSEQLSYKLFGNIMYGQAGNIYSRIYNVACAMSITLAGQMATEWTKAWFERNGMSVVYMDTDSNYVYDPKYSPKREKQFIKFFEAKYHKGLWNHCEKVFAVKPDDNCIILEREKVWFRMMFLSKKRYAGIVEESDGKKCWKLVTRGIELRRTGTIQFAKDFHEEYYDMIFRPEIPDSKVFKEFVEKYHKAFYDLEFDNKETVEQITKRQKITMKIEDYKATTAQVNLMVRCKEDGEDLQIGSMLEYVLLKVGEKQKTNYAETVDRYLEDKNQDMLIHVDQYWDKEVFKPLLDQLVRLFPDVNWGGYHKENDRMTQKKYKACLNRLVKKKLDDQIETVRIIGTYKRFSKAQALELLEKAKEKYKDVDSEELHSSLDYYINFFVTNEFLTEGDDDDDD